MDSALTYTMLTVATFVRSYDRDCLDLQDDPKEYIYHLETELQDQYPDFVFFDTNSARVWPLALLKGHFGITGEALWPELPVAL